MKVKKIKNYFFNNFLFLKLFNFNKILMNVLGILAILFIATRIVKMFIVGTSAQKKIAFV